MSYYHTIDADDRELTAYEMGQTAAKEGKSESSNPYDFGSWLWGHWADGWKVGKE